ncbi:MAG TPA: hemin uptake protein HemP [Ramlibacter sp.]|nr:hemin uptake protein HemP [Ramlibacter sp.]HVZ42825.1 hemin uptake protein HemP [Ramlibacter sp.]
MSHACGAFEEHAASRAPALSSEQLLQGRSCVEIRHNGATYCLRATRLGKLILTK